MIPSFMEDYVHIWEENILSSFIREGAENITLAFLTVLQVERGG